MRSSGGLLALLITGHLTAQVITTFAGTDWTLPRLPLAARSLPAGAIGGVVTDTSGNVYFADANNNVVYRMSPTGMVTVVAGNGFANSTGDGGPATAASLNAPTAVALDNQGNLYIAESARIRKVSGGIITTLATGLYVAQGVAVDSAGNVYTAEDRSNRVLQISNGKMTTFAGGGPHPTGAFYGDGGPATSAALYSPESVALDPAGDLYISDNRNYRIRRVSKGIISTFAGTGRGSTGEDIGPTTTMPVSPVGLGTDQWGAVYVTEGYTVRKISNGLVQRIAGIYGSPQKTTGDGGLATGATFGYAMGVAADRYGNVYVGDWNVGLVRKIDTSGVINTIAGNGQFRFSGDGGPATSATLYFDLVRPSGLATDAAGNLYVADTDNHRVRKIRPDGVITTIAGNGDPVTAGDGGPALSASFYLPVAVAVNAAGDVFVSDNNRVRKISNGMITAYAGNGEYTDSGDGGPAVSAGLAGALGIAVDAAGDLYIASNNSIRKVSGGIIATIGGGPLGYGSDGSPAVGAGMRYPWGIAVDSKGVVYFSDYQNNRVRKIEKGIITTVAGNGKADFAGDGGPATQASLFGPYHLAVDKNDDLYIADATNLRIRKVSHGMITTVAGAPCGAPVDGVLATESCIVIPHGVAVDRNGAIYISEQRTNRIRKVLATPPRFVEIASPVSLSAESGGRYAEGNLVVSTVEDSAAGPAVPMMAYTASVSAGSNWLSLSRSSGLTPGLITLRVDPLVLVPGTYSGEVTVNVPLASPAIRRVAVQVTVVAGQAPRLAADQSHLSFTYTLGTSARSQAVSVSNAGGGPLPFTVAVTQGAGTATEWLRVTPLSGTATPNVSATITVTADPAKLTPGTYTGVVTLKGAADQGLEIPVSMTITSNPLIVLLSKTGVTFTAVSRGGLIPPQTVGIRNLGQGAMGWTVDTSTLSGGNWLTATPSTGVSDPADSGATPLITISANPANLPPGAYYGLVRVRAAFAANSPQEVVAVLWVLPSGSDLAPVVQPSSLTFSTTAGASPGSQDLLIYDPTGTRKSFRSVRDGAWLATLPGDATLDANLPTKIVVQPIVDGYGAGTYKANLTLQFSDGRVSQIPITMVVSPVAKAVAAPGKTGATREVDSSCTPRSLFPTLTSLGNGFSVPAGFPHGLEAVVIDDCGNVLQAGSVKVEFSNGDAPVMLAHVNDNRWDGTWKTSTQQISQVTLKASAQSASGLIKGEAEIIGGLGLPQPAPVVADQGVVSAASFRAQPLAPGALVAIFGSRLSEGTLRAPENSWPQGLGGTTVTIGDNAVPLYFVSDGQVNGIIPYGIGVNTNQQLLVQRGSTYATPVYVDVAAAQPAVFESGGVPIVADARGNLVNAGNPARAGDVVVIYCAGLGPVTPGVVEGNPATGLSSTVNVAAVTLSGRRAEVIFAGLTPGFIGLYQINAVLPATLESGTAALVVEVGGQSSQPVGLLVSK